MPTYPYACTECGHQFETRQSFSDDPLTECPECGGRLKKVWGSVGVVFKGSGFYRTDSRNGSSTSSAKESAGASGSGESTSGGKDSTSDTKTTSDTSSSSSTSKTAAAKA